MRGGGFETGDFRTKGKHCISMRAVLVESVQVEDVERFLCVCSTFLGSTCCMSSMSDEEDEPTTARKPDPALKARCLIFVGIPTSHDSCTPGAPNAKSLPCSVPTARRD